MQFLLKRKARSLEIEANNCGMKSQRDAGSQRARIVRARPSAASPRLAKLFFVLALALEQSHILDGDRRQVCGHSHCNRVLLLECREF